MAYHQRTEGPLTWAVCTASLASCAGRQRPLCFMRTYCLARCASPCHAAAGLW